jgi:hypothetical protein
MLETNPYPPNSQLKKKLNPSAKPNIQVLTEYIKNLSSFPLNIMMFLVKMIQTLERLIILNRAYCLETTSPRFQKQCLFLDAHRPEVEAQIQD